MSSLENISPESPPGNNSKDTMLEPKPKPKMIRVLTVLAYVLSVSMAAILLSIYYIFMWDGRPHLGARRSSDVEMMEPHNFSDGQIYMVPLFSKFFSEPSGSYNLTTRGFTNNNVTQDMSWTDALDMVNETRDDYGKEFNTTSNPDNMTEYYKKEDKGELQQQITAIESEEVSISSTVPTTTTEEVSVTWSDDYDDFEKSNIFFKKMVGNYNY